MPRASTVPRCHACSTVRATLRFAPPMLRTLTALLFSLCLAAPPAGAQFFQFGQPPQQPYQQYPPRPQAPAQPKPGLPPAGRAQPPGAPQSAAPVARAGYRQAITRDAAGGVERHFVILPFAARWIAGEVALNEELAEAQWREPSALADLETTEGLGLIVNAAWDRIVEAR